MSNFLQDSLVGTAGTTLQTHVGQIGATWTKLYGGGTLDVVFTSDGLRIRQPTQGSDGGGQSYYATSGVPSTLNYSLQATLHVAGTYVSYEEFRLAVHIDPVSNNEYGLMYGQNVFSIYTMIGGTLTVLSPGNNYNIQANTNCTMTAVISGQKITGYVNGLLVCSSVVSGIPSSGRRVGFSLTSYFDSTETHGLQISNFSAFDTAVATGIQALGDTAIGTGITKNYTVKLNGQKSGTTNVTLSDGGAGGTFSASTFALTPETNSISFTYTGPSTAGTATITSTNDGSLANVSIPITVYQKWTNVYQHSFVSDSDVSAGGAGSNLIGDGHWIDKSGGFASVSGGVLNLTHVNGLGNDSLPGDCLFRDSYNSKNQRMIVRVPPGGLGLVLALKIQNNCMMYAEIDQNQMRFFIIRQGSNQNTINYIGGPGESFNNAHWYDIEVFMEGSFPASATMNIYDQGTSPPAFLSNLTSPTATTSASGIPGEYGASSGGSIGFGSYGLNGKVTDIALFTTTGLIGASLKFSGVTKSSVKTSAYDFTGNNGYAFGGTGSYQYALHRGVIKDFTPADGTRLFALQDSPNFSDLDVVYSTYYYYWLETFDGREKVYTNSVASNNRAFIPSSDDSMIIYGAFGHSYVAGDGSSRNGPVTFSNVVGQLLASDAFGVGARTNREINFGASGSAMSSWQPGAVLLYPALQTFVASGVSRIFVMLSTNDANAGWSADTVKSFYQNLANFCYSSLPGLKSFLIVVAPPAFTYLPYAKAILFAQGQVAAADGQKIFVVGLENIKLWSDNETSSSAGYWDGSAWHQANVVGNVLGSADPKYGGFAPYGGPFITTDNTHPNDWGHFVLGAKVASKILEIEGTKISSVSGGSHNIGMGVGIN